MVASSQTAAETAHTKLRAAFAKLQGDPLGEALEALDEHLTAVEEAAAAITALPDSILGRVEQTLRRTAHSAVREAAEKEARAWSRWRGLRDALLLGSALLVFAAAGAAAGYWLRPDFTSLVCAAGERNVVQTPQGQRTACSVSVWRN